MRISIPWGGIALIGGLSWVYMTDWPGFIGWIMVAWGVLSLILQVIVMVVMANVAKLTSQISPEEMKDMVYKTNHGRTLPIKKRHLRSVNKRP